MGWPLHWFFDGKVHKGRSMVGPTSQKIDFVWLLICSSRISPRSSTTASVRQDPKWEWAGESSVLLQKEHLPLCVWILMDFVSTSARTYVMHLYLYYAHAHAHVYTHIMYIVHIWHWTDPCEWMIWKMTMMIMPTTTMMLGSLALVTSSKQYPKSRSFLGQHAKFR